jgi:hypothetical protein
MWGADSPSLDFSERPLRGQKRRFDPLPVTSGLPPITDIIRPPAQVRLVPTTDSGAAANGISIQSPRRSARAVSAKGRPPSAFEVLRLMINSSLFGNSTARSPGLAPLRISRRR